MNTFDFMILDEFERQSDHNHPAQNHPAASKPQFVKLPTLQQARKLAADFSALIATMLKKDKEVNDLPSPCLDFGSFQTVLYYISFPK
jgi:hypothetical protein